MRTYTEVFIYNDEVDIRFNKLNSDYSGTWVLRFDKLGIFMSEEQVKLLLSAIGKEYWNLDVPAIQDPEEEYVD